MPGAEQTQARLSVRIGVGVRPFLGTGLADGSFWRLVDTLEEVGYDSLWMSDTARLGGLSPLPALAAVAARTRRLKLGTNVLVLPSRHPVTLARELATVDALSDGRLLPAGGLGQPAELAALGVPRGERAARLEESVAVIKALWRGQAVTRRDGFWPFVDVTIAPAPHRPKLELWLGGTAPTALDRIGRIADGWLGSFVGPDEFGAGVERIRASAAGAGRAIDEDHYGTTIFSAPDGEDLSPAIVTLLSRRPGLDRADHVAQGVEATRALLERFIAHGATKFVLIPMGSDPSAWLRVLHPDVVAPLEALGVAAR